jgi:hypothetical protein
MLTNNEIMEARDKATLLSIAGPWPIALTLATYLPAGDLINLARTSIPLRAVLHGLQPPSPADLQFTSHSRPRPALRIGDHQTSYWKQLKQAAPFLCASPTHTKGSSPRPCRYCSTPICEACIVRDSFAKRNENTFKNRCRFLCKECWNSGNPHRRCRFKGDSDSPQGGASRYNFAPGDGEFCACTNKDDGWLCISCKDMQNAEANASGSRLCFGEACSEALEEDKDRRRICLWCDRPMLRGRASIESRLAFDQKILQDARAKRSLGFEDRTRKQQTLYRMSRRELRGDEAVERDPLADAPQFVRHLDTMNYQSFMRREHAPSGEQVYQSKFGRWVYGRNFLIEIGKCCKRLPKRSEFRNLTTGGWKIPGRTNLKAGYWKYENCGKKRKQRDKRKRLEPVSIPTTAQSAEHVGFDLPEAETAVMNDDYAVALALQYELDREMAERLNAEFVADAAEVDTTQFEHEPADSDSNEGSSRHFLTACDFTVEAGRDIQDREHTLHHELIDDTVFQSQTQSNNSTLTYYSSENTRLPSGLDDSRSSIVLEPSLDLNVASDDLTSLPLSRTQPEAEVDASNHQANIEGPNERSTAGLFPDDKSPIYYTR